MFVVETGRFELPLKQQLIIYLIWCLRPIKVLSSAHFDYPHLSYANCKGLKSLTDDPTLMSISLLSPPSIPQDGTD